MRRKVTVELHESGLWYEVKDPISGESWTFETDGYTLEEIEGAIRVWKAWYKFAKANPEVQMNVERG